MCAGSHYRIVVYRWRQEELADLRERVSSSFVVSSTEALFRSGRIGRGIHCLCGLFSLHPVLSLGHSKMFSTRICIGGRKSFARQYLRRAFRRRKKIDPELVFVITAGCSYEFQEFLVNQVRTILPWRKTQHKNRLNAGGIKKYWRTLHFFKVGRLFCGSAKKE